MDIKRAAKNMRLLVRRHPDIMLQTVLVERDPEGRGVEHALWMLDQIITGEVEGEKGHRWLGDAAGMLRQMKVVTLDECRYANLFA